MLLFKKRVTSDSLKRQARRSNERLKVTHPATHPCKTAVAHLNYHLVYTSTRYARSVTKSVTKITKRVTLQVKPHILNSVDTVAIVWFVRNLGLALGINEVQKGAAIWLYPFSKSHSASAMLDARPSNECIDRSYSHARIDEWKSRKFYHPSTGD